jgi:hypothetical protein
MPIHRPFNAMDSVLLKDYRPRSTLVVPQTFVATPRFPIIDTHVHSPRGLNPTALRAWVDLLDHLHIETCFIFTDCHGEDFERLAQIYLPEYKSRFTLFCTLDTSSFPDPDFAARAVRELDRCHGAGAGGLGELTDKGWGVEGGLEALQTLGRHRLPRHQRLHIDDPRLDPVWARCAQLGLPVSVHVADHPSAWQPLGPGQERGPAFARYNLAGQDVSSFPALLARRDSLIARHSQTTFIACHLGNQGHDLTALTASMDRLPNMFLDISARDYELGRQPRAARAFFERFPDRVLFGTDFPVSPRLYQAWFRLLQTADEYIAAPTASWRLYGLELSDEILAPLYAGNARRLLQPSSRASA